MPLFHCSVDDANNYLIVVFLFDEGVRWLHYLLCRRWRRIRGSSCQHACQFWPICLLMVCLDWGQAMMPKLLRILPPPLLTWLGVRVCR